MKEGGAQAVKLEGGVRVAPQIRLLVEAGIPVMAHIGFTPQSEHALGGFRVQGRGAGAEQLLADAHAVQEAGAFAVVLEMVPAEIAGQVTKELTIPTIGIGAGVDCDAQVLVWPDMAGLNGGRRAEVREEVRRPARPSCCGRPRSTPTTSAAASSPAPSTRSTDVLRTSPRPGAVPRLR